SPGVTSQFRTPPFLSWKEICMGEPRNHPSVKYDSLFFKIRRKPPRRKLFAHPEWLMLVLGRFSFMIQNPFAGFLLSGKRAKVKGRKVKKTAPERRVTF